MRSNAEPHYLSVAYYFTDAGRDASAVLAMIGEGLADLAGPKARASIEVPTRLQHIRNMDTQGVFRELLSHTGPKEDVALFGQNAASRQAGRKEFLWDLDLEREPISGVHFESYLALTVGLEFLPATSWERLTEFAEQLSFLASTHLQCCHGLMDVGLIDDTGRGHLYGSIDPMFVHFQRLLARDVWLHSGERRKQRLRGVFWGQFLSPPLVARLEPLSEFIDEYRKHDSPIDRDLIRQFPDGSMVIWLSHSAEVFCNYLKLCPPHFERATWLYQRFEAAGLL